MSCEAVREFLLATDWDDEARRRALESLQHLDQCATCRAAVRDFDRLRLMLAPGQPVEPPGGWDAMQKRLADSAQPRRRQQDWFRPALAMAAALLLAFAFFEVGRQTMTPSNPSVVTGKPSFPEPAVSTISPSEKSHDVEAFRQVAEVYEGHAGWMLVSQNNSDVGVSADPIPTTRKVLLLRLNLWHGSEQVSNADLLVLAGQNADLTVPLPSGESLHYRIGASDDEPARLTLFLELKTSHGGEPLAALSTNLRLKPGQKLTAGKLVTSAGEYELKIDFAGSELAQGKL